MRVALISTARPGAPGSMGVYGDLVLEALREHASEIEAVPMRLQPSPGAERLGRAGRFSQLAQILAARRASARVQADVCHLLDGSFGYLASGLPLGRTLVTVHDLIPALQARGVFPVPGPGWAARRLISSSLGLIRQAGAVCAVSHCTARDVREITGREVDAVIHNPLRPLPIDVGPLERSGHAGAAEAGGYLLHVGNNGFYKNREGVLQIFAILAATRPDLGLVMAGPGPTDALIGLCEQLGLAGRVRWTVDPGDTELARLYSRARLLLFPSLYEGFGWPPLEALRLGCPVVCADAGSLPEVVADAALVWNPLDHSGFAAQALRLLEDEVLVRSLLARAEVRLQRFSLDALVEGLLPLYQRLAGARPERP